MKTLRFGCKLSLPSTVAIKHQVRIAEYRINKAKAEGRAEISVRLPGPTVPFATTGTEIDADTVSASTWQA